MTWKELKEKVESLGVKDDDEIWFIDIGDFGDLHVERHREDGAVGIS